MTIIKQRKIGKVQVNTATSQHMASNWKYTLFTNEKSGN